MVVSTVMDELKRSKQCPREADGGWGSVDKSASCPNDRVHFCAGICTIFDLSTRVDQSAFPMACSYVSLQHHHEHMPSKAAKRPCFDELRGRMLQSRIHLNQNVEHELDPTLVDRVLEIVRLNGNPAGIHRPVPSLQLGQISSDKPILFLSDSIAILCLTDDGRTRDFTRQNSTDSKNRAGASPT